MDSKIESALHPGRFIGWNEETGFVSSLEEVEREIAALIAFNPMRAVSLYEAFIAACYLKAEEIDSEWEFGNFVAGLACGWIQASQAAGADPEMTAKTLLSWMDRDDYGVFNELGSNAVKVLDRAGLAAFERQVRTRFETACGKREERVGNYFRDEWAISSGASMPSNATSRSTSILLRGPRSQRPTVQPSLPSFRQSANSAMP